VRNIFNQFDSNNNGMLDAAELILALRMVGMRSGMRCVSELSDEQLRARIHTHTYTDTHTHSRTSNKVKWFTYERFREVAFLGVFGE